MEKKYKTILSIFGWIIYIGSLNFLVQILKGELERSITIYLLLGLLFITSQLLLIEGKKGKHIALNWLITLLVISQFSLYWIVEGTPLLFLLGTLTFSIVMSIAIYIFVKVLS